MTEEELEELRVSTAKRLAEYAELRVSTAKRLAEYAGCSTDSAEKFMKVMSPSFSCDEAMYYHIHDNLLKKGY